MPALRQVLILGLRSQREHAHVGIFLLAIVYKVTWSEGRWAEQGGTCYTVWVMQDRGYQEKWMGTALLGQGLVPNWMLGCEREKG